MAPRRQSLARQHRAAIAARNHAQAVLDEQLRRLVFIESAIEAEGFNVNPCDICDHLNWYCGCGCLTCNEFCPRCERKVY